MRVTVRLRVLSQWIAIPLPVCLWCMCVHAFDMCLPSPFASVYAGVGTGDPVVLSHTLSGRLSCRLPRSLSYFLDVFVPPCRCPA